MRLLRALTVAGVVATATALSSCGFAGDDDPNEPAPVDASPTTAGPAVVRPSAPAVAVRAGLRPASALTAALLSAPEVGAGAAPVAVDGDRADMGGCPDLAGLLGQGRIRHPDQQWAEADFGSAAGMPVVLVGLVNEPTAEVTADLAQVRRGVASCTSARDPADRVDVRLQPASLPAAAGREAAALRSSSTVNGVTVTQYIALVRVAPDILLSLCYGSTDQGPDPADAVLRTALAKASAQLAR